MSRDNVIRGASKRPAQEMSQRKKWLKAFIKFGAADLISVLNLLENGCLVHRSGGRVRIVNDSNPHTVTIQIRIFRALAHEGFLINVNKDKTGYYYGLNQTDEYKEYRQIVNDYYEAVERKVDKFVDKHRDFFAAQNRKERRNRQRQKKIKNNPDKFYG